MVMLRDVGTTRRGEASKRLRVARATEGRTPEADQISESGTPPPSDRIGDLSMSLARAALRNPAITITIGTIILFAVARVPAEIFYSSLGVKPEDAGLDSVQILLQGVTAALLISLGVAVLYGVIFPFINAAYFMVIGRLARKPMNAVRAYRPGNRFERSAQQIAMHLFGEERRDVRILSRKVLRRSPLVVTAWGLLFAILILTLSAISSAEAIKGGEAPGGGPVPWRARRVTVLWADGRPEVNLPDCHNLYYLGEGGGRVALFDSKTGTAYRVLDESVQLSFPDHCD
jgi:hypothetical protein